MVAAGAVIELNDSGTILLLQRNPKLDWQAGVWEIPYGRLKQLEDVETGLRRELLEEIGISDIDVLSVVRVWHIFRGSTKADNELIGITYHCRTRTKAIRLSDEHAQYQWATPKEALELCTIEGIKQDILQYTLK